jgi:hypothetical protein
VFTRRRGTSADVVEVSPFLAQLVAVAQQQDQPDPGPSLSRRLHGWMWIRRRSHGIPAAALGGLGIVGVLVASAAVPWWALALVGWVVVLLVWARASHRHRAHAVASAAAAMVWLVLVAAEAVSPAGLVGLLVGAGVALAAPFTARYGRRTPAAERLTLTAGPRRHPSQVWDDMIGCDGGALPGSRLPVVESIPGGRAGTIALRGGRQHTGSAISAKPLIASAFAEALGLTAEQVEVEAAPSGLTNEARLLLLDTVTLAKPQPWQGPSLSLASGGQLAVARFGDAVHAMIQRFELGSGGRNLLIAGVQGAGKTQTVGQMLVESAHATFLDLTGQVRPLIGTIYCDGKGGQSLPEATDSPGIAWPAIWPEECARAILCFEAAMDARKRYLASLEWVDPHGRQRRGISWFDPIISGLPYLQLVIDEWPRLWREYPWMVDKLMRLATTVRSLGGMIVIVCQAVDGEEVGAANLRNMIASGGAIVFRTNDDTTAGMAFAGAIEVDPSSLPETMPGSCYVKGPQQRSAMARALVVDDMFGWLSDAPEWELGDVDVEAMGEGLELAPARRRFYGEHGVDPEAAPDLWAPVLAGHRGAPVEDVLAELVGGEDQSPAAIGREVPVADLVVRAVEELCTDADDVARADIVTWIVDRAAATGARRWSDRSIGDALADAAKRGAILRPTHGRYAPVGERAAA